MNLPAAIAVLIGAAVLGWTLANAVMWLASRRVIARMYGSAPWNWRVLLGYDPYTDWLRR